MKSYTSISPSPLKIVYVCGAAHSGSTLLGFLLGSHSEAFYTGEAKNTKFWSDKNIDQRKRSCKLCGSTCNIWKQFDPEKSATVHQQMSEISHKKIIIDSTKAPEWIINKEQENSGAKQYLIYLKRDGRAIVNSRKRKYHNMPFGSIVDKWKKDICGAEKLYRDFSGSKIKIQYEDLAKNPQCELSKICNLLEIKFENAMLNWQLQEHHPLGGNNGTQWLVKRNQQLSDDTNINKNKYYKNHRGGIILDERWRKELTEEEQRIVATIPMAGLL